MALISFRIIFMARNNIRKVVKKYMMIINPASFFEDCVDVYSFYIHFCLLSIVILYMITKAEFFIYISHTII